MRMALQFPNKAHEESIFFFIKMLIFPITYVHERENKWRGAGKARGCWAIPNIKLSLLFFENVTHLFNIVLIYPFSEE